MIQTEYLTFNGYREIIKKSLPVIRQLKIEGWKVNRPIFYRNHDSKNRDYITILVYKEFSV